MFLLLNESLKSISLWSSYIVFVPDLFSKHVVICIFLGIQFPSMICYIIHVFHTVVINCVFELVSVMSRNVINTGIGLRIVIVNILKNRRSYSICDWYPVNINNWSISNSIFVSWFMGCINNICLLIDYNVSCFVYGFLNVIYFKD